VDARATWLALQARLSAARAALDAGDRERALAEINAALGIDPHFLAAQSLRDLALAAQTTVTAPAEAPADGVRNPATMRVPAAGSGVVAASSPIGSAGAVTVPADLDTGSAASRIVAAHEAPVASGLDAGSGISRPPAAVDRPAVSPEPLAVSGSSQPVPAGGPPVSADGYAKFEQRAKRRRVDRQMDVARAALSAGRLRLAASALDEVIELDPNLPDLVALTVQFDELRRSTATAHRGPRVAAAAVLAIALLGASWLQDSTTLRSRPMIAFAPLIAVPAVAASAGEAVAGVAVEREPADRLEPGGRKAVVEVASVEREPAIHVAAVEREPAVRAAAVEREPMDTAAPAVVLASVRPASAPPPAVSPAETVEVAKQPEPAVVEPPRVAAFKESPAVAPVAAVVTPPPPADFAAADNVLVKQTLQRYRTAYSALDARSARLVWPAVDQVALARAFDGLASQTLTFDACDVRLRGESADVTCRGSARYVPKVGNREPHIEPRVWTFTLQKKAGDWKIDSARAER
jgi:hypothetical protein